MTALARTRHGTAIAAAAKRYGLDAAVVEAVVLQESEGHPSASRYEDGYWERYLAPKTEWAGADPDRVSRSYGLMQVMYPTAKQFGFSGVPEMLMVPDVGLEYGCRYLLDCVQWAERNAAPGTAPDVKLRSALAAYNGGRTGNLPDAVADRNAAYASAVLARVQR